MFVSHNKQDKALAVALCTHLRIRDLQVWLDDWELRPGLSWQEGILRGLQNSDSCAVLIGPAGFGGWHRRELEAALQRQGPDYPVIPVLLPGGPERVEIDAFLSAMTWVDFRAGIDDDAALDRLVWGITGVRPPRSPLPADGGQAGGLGVAGGAPEIAPAGASSELRERVLHELRRDDVDVAAEDVIAFAGDRMEEPHLRVMAVERLQDMAGVSEPTLGSVRELAVLMQSDPHSSVGKAGVRLAKRLLLSSQGDIELLTSAAANSNWEVRSTAVAVAREFDDPRALSVYMRIGERPLSYWRPLYTIVEHLLLLRPRLGQAERVDALNLLRTFLSNPRISEKTRAKLSEGISELEG